MQPAGAQPSAAVAGPSSGFADPSSAIAGPSSGRIADVKREQVQGEDKVYSSGLCKIIFFFLDLHGPLDTT